jgi:hypothetical protein
VEVLGGIMFLVYIALMMVQPYAVYVAGGLGVLGMVSGLQATCAPSATSRHWWLASALVSLLMAEALFLGRHMLPSWQNFRIS